MAAIDLTGNRPAWRNRLASAPELRERPLAVSKPHPSRVTSSRPRPAPGPDTARRLRSGLGRFYLSGLRHLDEQIARLRARWRDLWLERLLLPLSVRHLSGPRDAPCAPDEVVVLCLVKDAQAYVEPFIAHYERLGVAGIVLLDTGSSDATLRLAASHPRVSVYQTHVPFRNNNRQMRRYLLRRFGGRDRWVLVVDVDEFFDYPGSDRIRLDALLRYLREHQYTAMVCHQLDMLPERPLAQLDGHQPLQQTCPLYDISAVRKRDYFAVDGYGGERWIAHNTLANPAIPRHVGGIRATAFDLPEVYLIKHPLLLCDGRIHLVHQHFVDHAAVADISGVLYHYKFIAGFRAKVDAAVRSRAYADGSWEYQRYQRALDRDPNLSLNSPTAQRLQSVNELVDQGFLHVSNAYLSWIEEQTCAG